MANFLHLYLALEESVCLRLLYLKNCSVSEDLSLLSKSIFMAGSEDGHVLSKPFECLIKWKCPLGFDNVNLPVNYLDVYPIISPQQQTCP